uniref:Gamma-glutamylaminecyclotransferase n=1 Tax=Neogobius melanostomus TaxID=47308 RepID=A0A8C6TRK7_9GOBI
GRQFFSCSLSISFLPLFCCVFMARVFVYGTLKKGQPNYYRMFDSSNGTTQFLGTAKTVERFPLVIAGTYNIPYLLNIPGQGHQVHGEIYQVDDQMLRFLDAFEGVPTHYQRTATKLEVKEWAGGETLETLAPGSITEAFLYNATTYEPEWATLPTHQSYDSYGDHGLKYVEREARDE